MKKKCNYYPCHDLVGMECNNCYCPIYPCCDSKLGKFIVVKNKNVWDCSKCEIVHRAIFIKGFKRRSK